MRKALSVLLARKGFMQFVLYALCGGTGVVLDLGLFWLLTGAGVGYQAANLAGYATGTLASFLLNRHFTFQTYDDTWRRMSLFFGTAAVGYAVSALVLWLLVEKQGVDPLAAKVATLFLVLILQFSLNRAVTFRPRQSS